MTNEDKAAVAISIMDRMVLLISYIAAYPGQPTAMCWEKIQAEARGIKQDAKTIKKEG